MPLATFDLPEKEFEMFINEERMKDLFQDCTNGLLQTFPQFTDTLQTIIRNLENHKTQFVPIPDRLIHGDFHILQLLVHEGNLSIFDFDDFVFGDPAQDLAFFMADLYQRNLDLKLTRSITSSIHHEYNLFSEENIPFERLKWHFQIQCLYLAHWFWKRKPSGRYLEGKVQEMITIAQNEIPLELESVTLAHLYSQSNRKNKTMKKVMVYCQHVLGMGHFIRSLELVRGLKDFHVCFVNGGGTIPGLSIPSEVDVVQLPPIKSESNFKEIQALDGDTNIEDIKKARQKFLIREYEKFQPDLIIIELFPFGRKKFAYELAPLLARNRYSKNRAKVVSSVRDILVQKRDQVRHERRVCYWVNRYFDAVMVHSDPNFQRLEETFLQMNDIRTPVEYTGYISQSPNATGKVDDDILLDNNGSPLNLVSIGGGRVGHELLLCAVKASLIIRDSRPHKMLIFTGPYCPEEEYLALQSLVENHPHLILAKYSAHFVSWMQKASLSISMIGYNTCMDILATGVRALVYPFVGGNNTEQTIRGRKLEKLGVVKIIDELSPDKLAEMIVNSLNSEPCSIKLNLDGVTNSVTYLKKLANEENDACRASSGFKLQNIDKCPEEFEIFKTELRPYLQQCQEENKSINIFLRDDDSDIDEETLRRLLDISLIRLVPINLEIIPGRLTEEGIRLLQEHKRFHPGLFEFHQHGWKHINHEKEGRKCEFGLSRSFDKQLEDIANGKVLLEKAFEVDFFPCFTPPWNRCTTDTYKALDQLGFQVLSKDKGDKPPITGYRLREISVTLNIFNSRKEGGGLKASEKFVKQLISQIDSSFPIGILLHHKEMGIEAFSFLE